MKSMTELECVNCMLSAASEAPVSSLSDNATLEVQMAKAIKDEVTKEVQSHGWFWNKRCVSYTPDSSGYINIPTNIIEIDTSTSANYTVRDNRLFNMDDNTAVFTADVTLNIIELLDWDDLPQVARQFIALSSARRYVERTVGSSELSRSTRTDELASWINLRRHEQSVGDYNIMDVTTRRFMKRNSKISYIRNF